MDIEKLSLQPEELDKNTGRIIIPRSKEELEHLASLPLKHTPKPSRVEKMTQHNQITTPDKPPVQQKAAQVPPKTEPPVASPYFSATPTESTQTNSHSPPWITQLKIMGLCQLCIVLPLALVLIFLLRENRDLNRQYDSLNNELSTVKRMASPKNNWRNSGSPTLEKELSACLLYTSPSPRDQRGSRMPSSA